jgi:predicted MFS family arabinose efflux permease
MSHPNEVATRRALLRLPGMGAAFAASAVARLSFGTVSLSLLLVVEQGTGSFAAAGAVVGAYAIATLANPVKARAVDRVGPRRVLPALTGLSALCLLALAGLARAGTRDPAGYVVLAGLAGLSGAPIGAVMRNRWAAVTAGTDARLRAYSLDSAAEEVLFTVGPLLVAALVVLGGATLALEATAVLLAAGGVLLAAVSPRVDAERATREATGGTPGGRAGPAGDHRAPRLRRPRRAVLLGPLGRPGFPVLLAVALTTSVGTSAVDVTVTARAIGHHDPAAAGWVLAALSAGAVLGGLAWGRVPLRRPSATQITLLGVLAALVAGAAVVSNLVGLAVILFASGALSTPVLVVNYLAADRVAGPHHQAEATTWVATAGNIGLGGGATLAGLFIDRAGPTPPMLVGAGVLLGATLLVTLAQQTYDGEGST